MFIETYYDEKAASPVGNSLPEIPYPELSGEALSLWQEYLPIRRSIETLHTLSLFDFAPVPSPVTKEIERAKNAPGLFDRVEIWSRMDDPMAVGIIEAEKPRYFSIVRWGDAELTLKQVKKILRVEKWLAWLVSTEGIWALLIVIFAAVTLAK